MWRWIKRAGKLPFPIPIFASIAGPLGQEEGDGRGRGALALSAREAMMISQKFIRAAVCYVGFGLELSDSSGASPSVPK